jgi:hypothetical protein
LNPQSSPEAAPKAAAFTSFATQAKRWRLVTTAQFALIQQLGLIFGLLFAVTRLQAAGDKQKLRLFSLAYPHV